MHLPAGRTTTPGLLAGRPAAGGTAVVQAKLFRGRTAIAHPSAESDASPIVRELSESATEYVLRSTSRLSDPVVHVLRRDRKYLLGEQHDESKWPERSAGWDVDTMVEGEKAIPEQKRPPPDDLAQVDQPLESSHAYTIGAVLQWRAAFDTWQQSRAARSKACPSELDPGDDADAERALLDMEREIETRGGSDQPVGGTPEATVDPVDFEDESVADVCDAAAATSAEVAYHELVLQAGAIWEMIRRQLDFIRRGEDVPTTGGYQLMAKRLHEYPPRIAELMRRIEALQTGTADDEPAATAPAELAAEAGKVMQNLTILFAAVSPDISEETRASLGKRADGTLPLVGSDALGVINPARERAMIKNINAARAPLLVKIGNAHLAGVTPEVANSVAVAMADDFDQVTRQPSE